MMLTSRGKRELAYFESLTAQLRDQAGYTPSARERFTYPTHPRAMAVRERYRDDVLGFSKHFMPDIFSAEWSPMHLELAELWMQRRVAGQGGRLALAAPRAHAKTSLLVHATLVHAACYGIEPFVLVTSSSATLARNKARAVLTELEENDRIRQVFGDIIDPERRTQHDFATFDWRDWLPHPSCKPKE